MKIEYKKIIKSVLGFSLASWVSAIINFFILPISTRLFLTDELAKINLFYSIITILLSLVCFGFDQGYVRFCSEYKTEEDKNKLFTLCGLAGIAITVILLLLALPFEKRIAIWITGDDSFLVIIPLFFCLLNQLIYRYLSLYYRMRSSLISYTIVAVMSSSVVKVSYLIGSLINPTGETAIIIMMVTSILFLIVSVFVLKNKTALAKPRQYINNEFLKYSIPLIPVTFVVQINMYLPQYAIRSFCNFSELGVFSIAVTLASILTLIQSGINVFWSPYVFENHNKRQQEIWIVLDIICAIMVVCGIGIISFKDVIVLILGNDYRGAIKYMPLLVTVPVCATIGELTGVGTLLNKKGYLNLILTTVVLVVNLGLAFSFAYMFGAIGAAASSASCAVLLLLLKTYFGQKEYRSIKNYTRIVIYFALFIIVVVLNTIYQNVISFVGIVDIVCLLFVMLNAVKMIIESRHNNA